MAMNGIKRIHMWTGEEGKTDLFIIGAIVDNYSCLSQGSPCKESSSNLIRLPSNSHCAT